MQPKDFNLIPIDAFCHRYLYINNLGINILQNMQGITNEKRRIVEMDYNMSFELPCSHQLTSKNNIGKVKVVCHKGMIILIV